MAKGNFTATSCIKEHLDITYKKTKTSTRDKYAAVLYSVNAILKENGQETNPRKMNEDTINFLLRFWDDLAISTKKWYLHIMNRYLSFYKNTDCFVEVLQDGPNAERVARDYVHNFYTTDKTQSLTVRMAPGGGFVIKIIKQPKVVIDTDIDISDDVK